ncbi:uncharacterized protein [Montipora capricornis]
MPQCSFACLEIPTCFSYNLAAYPNINGKLLCELLPSDKYNNSDKFMSSESFHHFSIASTCSGWPCKNNGTCLPLYEENSYKCFCQAGFTGRDCENEKIVKSVIIGSNATYLVQLSKWLKPVSQSNSSWKLCWRGSRDGWASSTFHYLCDGKGPTVTIIKVNQYIFGGYASISWGSQCNCYRYDATAFLFSLRNKPGWAPTKLPQTGARSYEGNSIMDGNGSGPTFGGGWDVHISNNAASGTSSHSQLGHTYSPPEGHLWGSPFAATFLAGTKCFRPTEVEVFYLTS